MSRDGQYVQECVKAWLHFYYGYLSYLQQHSGRVEQRGDMPGVEHTFCCHDVALSAVSNAYVVKHTKQ